MAVFAVLIYHAYLSTEAFVEQIPPNLAKWLNLGYLGVDLFFIISGFIIMHIHQSDNEKPRIQLYIKKRFSRIFPIYWPVGIGVIILYILLPNLSAVNGGRDYSIVSSIFLIPSNLPTALSVGWTLIHEMIFYFIFLTFFINKRIFYFTLLFWLFAIIFFNTLYELTGWLKYLFSILNVEFILGVCVAVVYKNQEKFIFNNKFTLILGVLISVLTYYVLVFQYSIFARLIFGFGLALVLLGLLFQRENKENRLTLSLILLGNASFSIYLIHNPLLSITQRFARDIGLTWYFSLFFGVTISIFFGYLYHRLYEVPMLRFFRKIIRNQY